MKRSCDSLFWEYQSCCYVSYRKLSLDTVTAFDPFPFPFPVWMKGKKIKWLAQSYILNHQFTFKQKAERVGCQSSFLTTTSLFLAAGSNVVPLPFLTKFKSLLKRNCQPLKSNMHLFDNYRICWRGYSGKWLAKFRMSPSEGKPSFLALFRSLHPPWTTLHSLFWGHPGGRPGSKT